MKILTLGPYIGNFEYEIKEFRQFVRWVSEVLEYDTLYVNTHYNRLFMYDWIPPDNRININPSLTHDEFNQIDHRNRLISRNDFLRLKSMYKNSIVKQVGCKKQDIILHTLTYAKSSVPYPFYSKMYTPILLDGCTKGDHVFFVPTSNKRFNKSLIKKLEQDFDVKICIVDIYNHDRFEYNVKMMSEAMFTVCELGYWTLLCNQQKVPVVSWGRNISSYKKGELMNIGNKDSMVYQYTSEELTLKMIDYFVIGLNNE